MCKWVDYDYRIEICKVRKLKLTTNTYLYSLQNTFKCQLLKLRNKSWKPECVLSFNMGWRILVFYPEPKARIFFEFQHGLADISIYPEPEARDKIY